MRKQLIQHFFLLLVIFSKAQTIPNGGFENWTNYGSYSEPNYWYSSNYGSMLFENVTVCEQGSPGAVGNYYVKLSAKIGQTTGGLFGCGMWTVSTATPTGSPFAQVTMFPCNFKPACITGKYKYISNSDSCAGFDIWFTKWNTTTNTRDIVGFNRNIISGSQTNWTNFSYPITFFGSTIPDSAAIQFYVGSNVALAPNAPPSNNDYLHLDDLNFCSSVGLFEVHKPIEFNITPNPFSSQTTITCNEDQNNSVVKITDITGKALNTISFSGRKLTIEKDDLSAGIYFIQVIDENKNSVTKKIIIQ